MIIIRHKEPPDKSSAGNKVAKEVQPDDRDEEVPL